jgi:hypothetical protein
LRTSLGERGRRRRCPWLRPALSWTPLRLRPALAGHAVVARPSRAPTAARTTSFRAVSTWPYARRGAPRRGGAYPPHGLVVARAAFDGPSATPAPARRGTTTRSAPARRGTTTWSRPPLRGSVAPPARRGSSRPASARPRPARPRPRPWWRDTLRRGHGRPTSCARRASVLRAPARAPIVQPLTPLPCPHAARRSGARVPTRHDGGEPPWEPPWGPLAAAWGQSPWRRQLGLGLGFGNPSP